MGISPTQEGRHCPDRYLHGGLGQICDPTGQPTWQTRSSHCSTYWGKYDINCLGKLYRRANSTAVRVARRSYKTYRCSEGSPSGAKITQIGHLDVAKILAPTLVTSNLSSY